MQYKEKNLFFQKKREHKKEQPINRQKCESRERKNSAFSLLGKEIANKEETLEGRCIWPLPFK